MPVIVLPPLPPPPQLLQPWASDWSDSDALPAPQPTPIKKRVRRQAAKAKRAGEIFALPSFSDLAVPHVVPPEKGRGIGGAAAAAGAGVMLQLRSVEAKLALAHPAETAVVRAAVELERSYLQDGVPKTLRDELDARRASAQGQSAVGPASEQPVHVFVDQYVHSFSGARALTTVTD